VGTIGAKASDHEERVGPSLKLRRDPLDREELTNLERHARVLGVGTDIPWLLIGRGKPTIRIGRSPQKTLSGKGGREARRTPEAPKMLQLLRFSCRVAGEVMTSMQAGFED
jgi:hypothetical protein